MKIFMIDDLLNKLSKQEKDFLNNEIFAPYIKGGAQILVRLNNIIYKLKTPKFKKDGFGIFKAIDANNAKLVREAELFEKDEYLQLLPKVDLILIGSLGRWLAYPANTNDFKRRFGIEPALVSVLVADNVEVMDTVETRFDGIHFWFDCIKLGGDIEKKESLRDRLSKYEYTITKTVKSGLTPEEIKAYGYAADFHKEANKSQLEKRLESELAVNGASMDKMIERGENVEVQWRDNRTHGTYTSILKKDDLSVVTAGICLSGEDKKFDLHSLVSLCRQNENMGGPVHIGRGGMDENAYWRMYGDRS